MQVFTEFDGHLTECYPEIPAYKKMGKSYFEMHRFTFDAFLVTLMVIETWVLPLALAGVEMPIDVQFLRLLRLLRLARMVRWVAYN